MPIARWGLNDSVGAFAHDSYGSVQVSLRGDAVWIADADLGQVLALDGGGGCAEIENPQELNSEFITVTSWVRLDPGQSGAQQVIGAYVMDPSSSEPLWELRVSDSSAVEFIVTPGGSDSATTVQGGALDVETWYHVGATWDGTIVRVYLDGAEVGSTELVGKLAAEAETAWIGCNQLDGTRALSGRITDTRFVGLALTPQEIDELAKNPHLVSRWTKSEAQSERVFDEVGSHHGIPEGQLFGNEDPIFGSFLSFDGVDDGIAVAHHVGISPEHITLGAWIRVDQPASNEQFFTKDSTGNGRGWQFLVRSDGRVHVIFLDGLGVPHGLVSTVRVTDLQWHHVAATHGSSGIALYVDGSLQGSKVDPFDAAQDSTPLHIGRSGLLNPSYFSGDVADARLYDRALRQDEISALVGASL